MFKTKLGIFTSIFITLAIIITLLYEFDIFSVSPDLMIGLRWSTALVLIVNAFIRKNLTTWIIVCMILGVFVGIDFPNAAMALQPLSKGFIKLVKTIVAPIIFATLVYGIAGHSDLKQVGRMAWKSMLYFFCATSCAIFIGLAVINITQAGVGIDMQNMPQEELPTPKAPDPALQTLPENVQGIYKFAHFIYDLFPENIVKSMYENQVLQVVVFSVLFGIGLAMVEEKKRKPMVDFTESLSEVMFKFTNIIMYFAPIGVGAAMAYTVGHLGVDILKNLFMLLGSLYLALIFFHRTHGFW